MSLPYQEEVALRILTALLSNPSRYDYITELVVSGKITQEQANLKNVSKAIQIANTFSKEILK
jgi:hypothetical protein